MSQLDKQVGGNHYKNMPIGVAEFAEVNGLSYLQGSVIKYTCRDKVDKIEDWQKAIHCLEMLIELEAEK
jgi:hypothetical protein